MLQSDRTQEFVRLLFQAEPRLYAYLRAQIFDRASAEDVFQETAAMLWKSFDQYQPGTNFLAWAYQVARNRVREYHRRARRERKLRINVSDEFLDLVAAVSEEISTHLGEMQDALDGCMQRLRVEDRAIMEHLLTRSGTVKEIAAASGRPYDTVKSAIKRSRRSLFDCVRRKLSTEIGE